MTNIIKQGTHGPSIRMHLCTIPYDNYVWTQPILPGLSLNLADFVNKKCLEPITNVNPYIFYTTPMIIIDISI